MNKEDTKQAILGFTEFFKGITGNQDLKIPDDIAKEYEIEPNKWIPVSERLPETTDYYLITVGINEYGLMIPSVRTALYNAKTKDFTVHTGTNMCIVGDIVAWCDCLPKPYKAEKEDN